MRGCPCSATVHTSPAILEGWGLESVASTPAHAKEKLSGVIVVVSLLVSLLTMYVMGRIWSSVFWGTPEDGVIAERLKPGATKVPVLMTGATVVVVVAGAVVVADGVVVAGATVVVDSGTVVVVLLVVVVVS